MARYAKVFRKDVVNHLIKEREKRYVRRDEKLEELLAIVEYYDKEKNDDLREGNWFGTIYHGALDFLAARADLHDIHKECIYQIKEEIRDITTEIKIFDREINYIERMKNVEKRN